MTAPENYQDGIGTPGLIQLSASARPTSSIEPQPLLRSASAGARSAREVQTAASWCHPFADSVNSAANSVEMNPAHQNSLAHIAPAAAAAASRRHHIDSAVVAVD